MVRFALMDCGAHIGVCVSIFGRRRAWRFRNPLHMDLTRIYALDLR